MVYNVLVTCNFASYFNLSTKTKILYKKNGKLVVQVATDTDGGLLRVQNKEETTIAIIAAAANGNGGVATLDRQGQITSEIP